MVLALPQVREGCDRIALEVETEAQTLAYAKAYDEGDYRAGIHRAHADGPGARVIAEDHKSMWLEIGTGEFGPRKRRIVPKPGNKSQVLAWKRDGVWHYAKSVAGRPGSHCMRDAAQIVADRHGLRFTDHLGDGRGLG
jgi:hypothetical protein